MQPSKGRIDQLGYLAETKNIRKWFVKPGLFSSPAPQVSAVYNVSLQIPRGTSLGLIGESGSGKSTLGRMMAGLETPSEGQILYRNTEISSLSLRAMRPYRRHIQMIFQNSADVFDPAYNIGQSIGEVAMNSERISARESATRVHAILEQVGLDRSFAERMSSEISGGQRQRANIARALVARPEFVVCDEPVSSLDYSLRKQILTLLNTLRKKYGLTYLFITHDLQCVPYVCDGLAIMYAGKIMERFDLDSRPLRSAAHPYTRLLLASVPVKTPSKRRKIYAEDYQEYTLIPDSRACCRFYNRCENSSPRCSEEEPLLRNIGDRHWVACHRI
jgi:peptide/nickel transport system ATP-binding protein